MKQLPVLLITISLFASCHTFVGKNGKKYKQLFPTKVKTAKFDTSRFVKRPFNISDHNNERAFENGKKIVESLNGAQLQELAKSGERYLVFFTYACPTNRAKIRKLEGLADSNNILLVSLTPDYNYIAASLESSRFSRYPYYIIEGKQYNRILIGRQITFIKDACKMCYDENRDDVRFAEYLVVENGSIRAVMDNDRDNVLTSTSNK